jgi:hypothetical protein
VERANSANMVLVDPDLNVFLIDQNCLFQVS